MHDKLRMNSPLTVMFATATVSPTCMDECYYGFRTDKLFAASACVA